MQPIAVLIATRNRERLLCDRALRSVAAQSHRPAAVVVANDGAPLSESVRCRIRDVAAPGAATLLQNSRAPGAAGAWNTGLQWLRDRGHAGFVAILDDDDEWDPDHLESNARAATESAADLTVSGLRLRMAGVDRPRPLIDALRAEDFLTGNPGWQGSNTFARLSLLLAVGGFRDGLASLNDRDLAVRVLRTPGVRATVVLRWTATWHLDPGTGLSSAGSAAKLRGLAAFWSLYGGEMSEIQAERFFARSERLFGFDRESIVAQNVDLPSRGASRGDLHE